MKARQRLSRLFHVRKKHPYESLELGFVKQYSLIIPKQDRPIWLAKGWIERPDFRDVHNLPKDSETVILGKPQTLLHIDLDKLIGKKITNFGSYGTYGMGGPGFLGFTLDHQLNADVHFPDENVLVYAVWGAAEYTLFDSRVVECNPRFYKEIHPWVSRFADLDIPNWDDLTSVLLGSRIDSIELEDSKCTITMSKDGFGHTLEFLRNDPRLPPHANGTPRDDAFSQGLIADFIIFQYENAVLYVS